MRTLLLIFLLLNPGGLWAKSPPKSRQSTFIGNGGNTGDLELQISQNQIRDAAQTIMDNDGDDGLCECAPVFAGHPVCETLNALTQNQRKFCADFVKSKAQEILSLVDRPDTLRIEWTEQDIDVDTQVGPRYAEGVADTKGSRITLNQPKFLNLNQYERVFILTHEYGHFLKVDGKYLTDEQTIGAFDSVNGGRQLLNAMGAAFATEASRTSSAKYYRSALLRSKGRSQFWFQLGLGATNYDTSENNYQIARYTQSNLQFRWEPGRLGLNVRLKNADGAKTFFDDIKVTDHQFAAAVGLSYKFYLSSNPLSYWGQAHILPTLMLERLESRVGVKDPYIDEADKASSTGLTAGVNFFIPFRKGFWAFAGIDYNGHRLSYEKLDFKQDLGSISTTVGVSYGF